MRLLRWHKEWWNRLHRYERIGYKVMVAIIAGLWTVIGIHELIAKG